MSFCWLFQHESWVFKCSWTHVNMIYAKTLLALYCRHFDPEECRTEQARSFQKHSKAPLDIKPQSNHSLTWSLILTWTHLTLPRRQAATHTFLSGAPERFQRCFLRELTQAIWAWNLSTYMHMHTHTLSISHTHNTLNQKHVEKFAIDITQTRHKYAALVVELMKNILDPTQLLTSLFKG